MEINIYIKMNSRYIFHNKIQKIKEEYPLLEGHNDVWVLGLYESICNEQIIDEFISKTISTDKTIDEFNKRFKLNSSLQQYMEWGIYEEGSLLLELDSHDYNEFEKINKFLESFGYFPAFIFYPSYKKYSVPNYQSAIKSENIVEIRYESKYDTEVSNPKEAYYHLVPDIYLEKVKLVGLTPKSKSKIANHPERIYLLNPDSMDVYEDIALKLYQSLPEESRKRIKKYYLLGIYVDELKDIKLYNDPNFNIGNGAVWTYKNIPPKYIEILDEIYI